MLLPDLYLASASPRRRELLLQIGLRGEVVSAPVVEYLLDNESPENYVQRLVHQPHYIVGFSWSVSIQGKARLVANGRRPLQEAERGPGC